MAEIGPGGCLDALQGAAERRVVEIELKDLALGQMRFQLHGTQALAQLAGEAARMRFEDACDLHGQRRAAGDDATIADQLPERAQRGNRIDAGVMPEPAILVGDQRLDIQGRDILKRNRVAPDSLRIGKRAQRGSIAGKHHGAASMRIRQGQREQEIENDGDGRHAEDDEGKASQPTPPRVLAEGGRVQGHGRVRSMSALRRIDARATKRAASWPCRSCAQGLRLRVAIP